MPRTDLGSYSVNDAGQVLFELLLRPVRPAHPRTVEIEEAGQIEADITDASKLTFEPRTAKKPAQKKQKTAGRLRFKTPAT